MKHPMNGWEESDENEIRKCDSDTRRKAMKNSITLNQVAYEEQSMYGEG